MNLKISALEFIEEVKTGNITVEEFTAKTIERIKVKLNPKLEIQGILLTMYDKRNKLSEQIESDVRDNLGALVYDTVIPRNVRLSEAPSFSMPALIYDHKCTGAIAYQKLAAELLKREHDFMRQGKWVQKMNEKKV